MARTKKTESVPVRIRFKELKNGGKSIYLDIYTNGKRSYEFLKLALVPEISPEARAMNEHTLKAANAIKAQRIIDLANKKPVLALTEKAKMTLIDWLKEYSSFRVKQGRNSIIETVHASVVNLNKYNPKIKVCEVDREFIEDFVEFLSKQKNRRTKEPLAKRTIARYAGVIRSALNFAVEQEIITHNPVLAFDWSSIKGKQSMRDYLTIDEVGRLIATPYKREDVTKPFLFVCFSGLRVSDLRQLKWKDIIEDNGKVHLELIQKKTGKVLYLPLSQTAQMFLPKKNDCLNENIFNLPDLHIVGTHLARWAKLAQINKKITMHVGRHTFATMTLTTGADIYTTSELLGHSDVETTQIYGKIVDSKKKHAVYLIDRLFD